MKKGVFKRTGALVLAASLAISMAQVPVYGAATNKKAKTVTVTNQKELNKALKVAKGKKAISIVIKAKASKDGKATAIKIPKGNYKNLTITVKGNKVKITNNATLKTIVLDCKGAVSVANNGKVTNINVKNAKSVNLTGDSKKEVKVNVSAKDTTITTEIKVKITCSGKNENVTVNNKSGATIRITDADGNTTKVKDGQKRQVETKTDDKKEDTKDDQNKTDDKKDDTKDDQNKTDDKKDDNNSSGGSSSGGSVTPAPSGMTAADLLKQGFQLKWSDEFNGTALNRADWNVETHEKGWVNSEWQAYVDSTDNIKVQDGKLVIKPVKTVDEDGNASYTSGRVNTQGKHDFKYGYFECRAKVPTGKGYLPAFWMMPTDENLYGQWPKCGEIDIMEVMGQETNKAYGTIHYGEPHDQSQGTYSVSVANNFADSYHTYAVDWEPGKITWYVDGIKYHEESDWFSAKSGQGTVAYPAPFDQPFYMILNLAVGGSWVGYPDDSTTYDDQQFAIDYVKVYQKDSYDENVTKPIKNVVLRDPDATGNYINNGDFSVAEDLNDDVNWKFLTTQDGEGSAEIKDKQIVISATKAGNADYSIQLVQPNVPLKKGGKYKVTFDAYADAARTMIADISGPDHNFTRYLKDTTVELGTEKKTHTLEFQMTSDSDANGRLEFNLGNTASTATVYISNVRIVDNGYEEIEEDTTKKALADGNYVYNGSFQEGTGRLGYWEITNDADAEVAVTGLEDGRRLKVTSNVGTAAGKVLVGQSDLALGAGSDYELSFTAQADEAKTMTVTVAGETYTFALTTEKKNYSVKIKTATDLQNKNISFDLGLGTTVYLDDVRIDEDALIKNGSFNAGFSGFEVYCSTPSNVTYVVDSQQEENAADFTIKDTGDADWHIQLKQTGVNLEEGQWYRLSMKMKSSIDRKVSYALQRDGSKHTDAKGEQDWTPYCQVTVDLTKKYQTFSKEFQMKEGDDPGTVFNIAMGAVGETPIKGQHRICIDDIVLEKIEAPEIKPEVAGKNLIANGDFANQTESWGINTGKDTNATTELVDGGIKFKVKDVGTWDWDIQLKQSGIKLEKGCKYRLNCKLTSTEARTIKLALMSTSYNWYGGADVALDKDTEYNLEYEFTMNEENDSATDLVVSMGQIYEDAEYKKPVNTPVSDITLKEFSLTKISEEEDTDDNLLKNASFDNNDTTGWNVIINTTEDGKGAVADKTVSDGTIKFAIQKPGTEDWHVQLKQSGIKLEKDCTYQVTFDVVSTMDRSIKLAVMSKNYAWYGGDVIALKAGEVKKVTVKFTMTAADDDDAVMAISMGQLYEKDDKDKPMETPASDITLSNISLAKVTE